MKNKVYNSFAQAVADIPEGASVMMGWWGPATTALNLILALRDHGVKNLTLITVNTGGLQAGSLPLKPGWEKYRHAQPYILLQNKQVQNVITGWGGSIEEQDPFTKMILNGEVEVESLPHGTLAEKIRAGGAGVYGFYVHTGVGTPYERGKEKRIIGTKECLFETALRADFSFVRADKADKMGNLTYRLAQRGWNALIAKAANVTIAEVNEIVEIGELDPENIVTPGFYVDRIVQIPEGTLK
jgi:3-oxoacid CoA-transferase subunit A